MPKSIKLAETFEAVPIDSESGPYKGINDGIKTIAIDEAEEAGLL